MHVPEEREPPYVCKRQFHREKPVELAFKKQLYNAPAVEGGNSEMNGFTLFAQ